MNSGRTPGKDGLPSELFKALRNETLEAFHSILTSIREEEEIPSGLHNATIVSLYKNKGSRTNYWNYRGISLLSITGKILARIILNKLITTVSEKNLAVTVWLAF